MFTHVVSLISSKADHPVVFSMFLIAGVFLVAAVIVDQVTGNGVASGFLAIYALFATVLGTVGYGILFGARALSSLQKQTSPA